MKLIQIEYFNSIARHLNFTTAARSLFVTQPLLSKQIALLEKELGVQLIYRDKHTVCLTPAGSLLFKEFENINIRIDQVLERVKSLGHGAEGKISIGCLETINVDMFFPDLVKNFSRTYPGIDISIERSSFSYLRKKLQEGIFDLIITLSIDIQNSHNLFIKNIHERNGYIVISNNNRLASRETVTFRDLSKEPFIIISHSESPGAFAKAIETAKKHDFINIKEVNNVETLLSHLELGLGFAILDKSIGEHRKNSFRFIDLPDAEVFYVVYAYKKENKNPAISLLLNMI